MPIPTQSPEPPVAPLKTKYLHVRVTAPDRAKWKRHARACKWSLSELAVNTLNTACDGQTFLPNK